MKISIVDLDGETIVKYGECGKVNFNEYVISINHEVEHYEKFNEEHKNKAIKLLKRYIKRIYKYSGVQLRDTSAYAKGMLLSVAGIKKGTKEEVRRGKAGYFSHDDFPLNYNGWNEYKDIRKVTRSIEKLNIIEV